MKNNSSITTHNGEAQRTLENGLPRLYSTQEIAQHFRVCETTILRKVRSGLLRAKRIGKTYTITAEDALKLLQ